MALLKRRLHSAPKSAPSDEEEEGTSGDLGSPFKKGYQEAEKEIAKNDKNSKGYLRELRFGGKTGRPKGSTVSIVFRDEEPLLFYEHNLFDVGLKGGLTCSKPNDCRLCEKNIKTGYKGAWRVYLINDDGSIEQCFVKRGKTEINFLKGLATEDIKKRCAKCGGKRELFGGKRKCKRHPDAKGSKLTDWIFTVKVTGENTDTRWNFDRDELVDSELREKLELVEDIDLTKILAPKADKYIDIILAKLTVDDEEEINSDELEEEDAI